MKLTLGQAAEQCGRSKATISKACKSGRLSYEKGEGGSFQIDPAELVRVFPERDTVEQALPTSNGKAKGTNTGVNAVAVELAETRAKLEASERMLSDARERADDLKAERDKWQGQAERLLLERPAPTPEHAPMAEPVTAENQTKVRPGLIARLLGKST